MSKTIFSTCAALAALLIASAAVAHAQQGLIVHKALSLDMAMAMTQGSLAKCREMHYKCAITVLDATGRTIVALQDDGANLHRFDVARKKAYTALVYRKPSKEVVEGWRKKTAEPVPCSKAPCRIRPSKAPSTWGTNPIIVDQDTIGAIA